MWSFIENHFSQMASATSTIIILGVILSISITADAIARRTCLPRVSVLVLIGFGYALIKQIFIDGVYNPPLEGLREPLIDIALVMVAFLLGGQLTLMDLKRIGPLVFILSLSITLVGFIVVFAGLTIIGYSLAVAVTLAAIAVATDPAAVTETINDSGQSTRTSRVILGVVAIDDAWGIIVFGLCMAFLGGMYSVEGSETLIQPVWELGGAILLGIAFGFPAAWITGRLYPGKPTQVEALALILLLTGISDYLEVSSLLSAIIVGFIIVNVAQHHTRSFSEVEHIEWPFLVFFFFLAGASINLEYLHTAIFLILAYILLRVFGRYLGGLLGVAYANKSSKLLPNNIGLAMTPQAGVAMGMALLAAEHFPEQGNLIVTTVVTSTIVFEVLGPYLTSRIVRQH